MRVNVIIAKGKTLPLKYKDHLLAGNYKGLRECDSYIFLLYILGMFCNVPGMFVFSIHCYCNCNHLFDA